MLGAKPLGSLSPGLLARKGQARPAMRPQTISFDMAAGEDDLGWNDMGDTMPLPAASAMPPVLVERAALTRGVEAAVPDRPPVSPETAARVARESAALTATRKAAFTLRLDAERHLRLRLSAAIERRSAQQLVTEALDAFLSRQPGLDAVVAGLPQSVRKAGN